MKLNRTASRITFLSTLSLRRATHYDNYNLHCVEISIHALLAESDPAPIRNNKNNVNFYPRSPCGERPFMTLRHCTTYLFLSTLSLRRATQYLSSDFWRGYFYPRSPCGERRAPRITPTASRNFYPRSPCGERLNSMTHMLKFCEYFYPRSPCGERQADSPTKWTAT